MNYTYNDLLRAYKKAKTQMLQHRRILHPRAKPQLEFADCLPEFLK